MVDHDLRAYISVYAARARGVARAAELMVAAGHLRGHDRTVFRHHQRGGQLACRAKACGKRAFRDADGSVSNGALRVRFGELEARGIALTPSGRDLYDQLSADVEAEAAADATRPRAEIARSVWSSRFPRSEAELERRGLAFFTYHGTGSRPAAPGGTAAADPVDLDTLLETGAAEARPIVYEDFLPRSAAGIFTSNLSGAAGAAGDSAGVRRDAAWLSQAIGRPVHDPNQAYASESEASLRQLSAELGTRVIARRGHLVSIQPAALVLGKRLQRGKPQQMAAIGP
jgi:uncharacterized glyoxalase superfamily metalloenzyme YdcJ